MYLTRQVAGGDVPQRSDQSPGDYYTAQGNPPGVWAGRGLAALHLSGQVTPDQMKSLFGEGRHPDHERLYDEYLGAHLESDMTDAQVDEVVAAAHKQGDLGRRFPAYQRLEDFNDRVAARAATTEADTGRAVSAYELAQIKKGEAARQRTAVAGYDIVFAPAKSVSLLWALHPDAQVREAIGQAHERAVSRALTTLEKHAAFTRRGTGGVAQVETNGLIVACFDHYDSRAGDPNNHTHAAVLNKVQDPSDGRWRSLDGRALYAAMVMVSEQYNSDVEAELVGMGARFENRASLRGGKRPVREVAGVSKELVRHFSRRSQTLNTRYSELIAQYRATHGHDPSTSVADQLARQATIETRPEKHLRSLAQMRRDWHQDLANHFGSDAVSVFNQALRPSAAPVLQPQLARHQIEKAATAVIKELGEHRATWNRWNVQSEAERYIRQFAFSHPAARRYYVQEITQTALSPQYSVQVTAPSLTTEPALLRRGGDGASVFAPHASIRYTSPAILDAEQCLVDAAKTRTPHYTARATADAAIAQFQATSGRNLDAGQQRLVAGFATSSRALVAAVGPAGSGKTTAMRALAHTLYRDGRRLVPLGTSANSAAVLEKDLGMPTSNIDKLLWEHTWGHQAVELFAGDAVRGGTAWFQLEPGDVVLVDEMGLASTAKLDRLQAVAARHGAVVRWLGDPEQASAVGAGGALRLVVDEVGAIELDTLHRFVDPAMGAATLKLREGDSAGLDYFADAGWIHGGSPPAMIDAAYAAWRRDMAAGYTSVMAAATNDEVADLSARARRDRVAAGLVEAGGVRLHNDMHAGVGDWVVTRRNNRLVRFCGNDFVRNGYMWTVTARGDDGSLRVRHHHSAAHIWLDGDYVANNLELAYATTVQRVQGDTVDTIHGVITRAMHRGVQYVVASRARLAAQFYAVTHDILPVDPDDRLYKPDWDPGATAGREILENVLVNTDDNIAAKTAIKQSQDDAASLKTLVPQFFDVLENATADHYIAAIRDQLPAGMAEAVIADDARPVTVALLHAEAAGWHPTEILHIAARSGLTDAKSPAAVISARINNAVDRFTPSAPLAAPTEADARRYARLIKRWWPKAGRVDPNAATTPPAPNRTTYRQGPDPVITARTTTAWAQQLAAATGIEANMVATNRAWPAIAARLATAHTAGANTDDIITAALAATGTTSPGSTGWWQAASQAIENHAPATTGQSPPLVLPTSLRAHTAIIETFGADLADKIRTAPAWPAVVASARRAEELGRHASDAIADSAAPKDLRAVDDPASLLAWRIGRGSRIWQQLGDDPAPASLWRQTAWSLKAAEQHGASPAQLIRAHAGAANMTDAVAGLSADAGRIQRLADARDRLVDIPWANVPKHLTQSGGVDPQFRQWLTEAAETINNRVLAQTQTARQSRWITALGPEPRDPQHAQTWRDAVSIIAAYRDAHGVASDNPHQPLGAYPDAGRAGHTAWWHAVAALSAARRGSNITELGPNHTDQVTRDIAEAVYTTLPAHQQQRIRAEIAERLKGAYPTTTASGERDPILDGAYARHVYAALARRGHLTDPPTPATKPDTTTRPTAATNRPPSPSTPARHDPSPTPQPAPQPAPPSPGHPPSTPRPDR